MPDTMLAYTEPMSHAPSLDLVAIHSAADEQVDEIYRLTARMYGGLEALRDLGQRVCKGDDWGEAALRD